MMAFKPGEAELYMKTNAGAPGIVGYPETPTESLRAWLADPAVIANGWTASNVAASVKIFTSQISEAQIVALHGHCDVYLSLSRGEGFDIPAFCAKLAGNLMVYVNSGGPADFSTPDDYEVSRRGAVECHRVYGWQDGATYLDILPSAAVHGLRSAASRARGPISERISTMARCAALTVGAGMLNNLKQLVGPAGKVY
jgi:hypothetical protein